MNDLKQLQRGLWVVAAVGVFASLLGVWFEPERFWHAYLFSYVFCLGISLGSMALLMVHNLSGGNWGLQLRPILLAASGRPLLLAALLYALLLAGMGHLYEWSIPERVSASELLQKKQAYLNTPFFIVRAAIYFAVWLTLAWALRRTDRRPGSGRRRLSAAGLILYGLTATFMAFDLLMSLDAHFYSTVFGLLIATGQLVAALASALVLLSLFGDPDAGRPAAGSGVFNDLGNILMALVMTWAYLLFSEYMLIWYENLPHEIGWYLPLQSGPWQVIAAVVVLFHFAVPMALLLGRRNKRNPAVLGSIAGGLLAADLLYLYWLVVPRIAGAALWRWVDAAAVTAVIGLWGALLLRGLADRPGGDTGEALHE